MKSIFFILLFIITFNIQAQPPSKFYTRIGGNGYDVGYDVKQTLDNGYIITGSTSSMGVGNTDMYLLKLDSMGQIKFQNTFGNANNDIGKSVIQLIDSSYVIVGYTNSIGFGGYDIFLVKADKYGALVWQKTIGGTDWDFANSLQQTSDGGFIIAGSTYSYGYGNADGYVVKTDANGNITWSKTYGGANDDEFKSVIQTADGGYALCGYTKSYGDINGDAWVFKLLTNGDSVWSKIYGGVKEDFWNQIIEHPNSDLYVAGATASFGLGLLDAYGLRLNSIGVQILQQVIGTSGYNEEFTDIVVSKRSSNVLGLIEKEEFSGYGLQFKLIDFGLNLGYLNATDYGSILSDEMFKIIATKDKGYACVGYTDGYGAINSDVYFFKSDSNLVGSINITSLKESPISNFDNEFFPNPVSDILNIRSNTIINISQFKLFDLSGTELNMEEICWQFQNNILQIDFRKLNNGIYFIKYFNKIEKIIVLK
jgi:hypothetical protein